MTKSRIYFIRCNEFVKIGYSKDTKKRLSGLQSSNPYKLSIEAELEGDIHLERLIHDDLEGKHYSGEWFKLSKSEVEQVVSRFSCSVPESKNKNKNSKLNSFDICNFILDVAHVIDHPFCGFLSASKLVRIGNKYRGLQGVSLFNFSQWIKNESTSDFIVACEDKYGAAILKHGITGETFLHHFIFFELVKEIGCPVFRGFKILFYDKLLSSFMERLEEAKA